MVVSSKVLQNEQRAVFVIPKMYSFLLRKSTLLRILYWKERKAVSTVARSSHRRSSMKKGVLKNVAKFRGKRLCQSLRPGPQACNFIKKETLAQVFSCEFCEIFKKNSEQLFLSC